MNNDKRKNIEIKIQQLLDELTLAQKLSLSEVGQFGYQLAFVRNMAEGKLAVVKLDESVISINEEGDIDHHPDIQLRDTE